MGDQLRIRRRRSAQRWRKWRAARRPPAASCPGAVERPRRRSGGARGRGRVGVRQAEGDADVSCGAICSCTAAWYNDDVFCNHHPAVNDVERRVAVKSRFTCFRAHHERICFHVAQIEKPRFPLPKLWLISGSRSKMPCSNQRFISTIFCRHDGPGQTLHGRCDRPSGPLPHRLHCEHCPPCVRFQKVPCPHPGKGQIAYDPSLVMSQDRYICFFFHLVNRLFPSMLLRIRRPQTRRDSF